MGPVSSSVYKIVAASISHARTISLVGILIGLLAGLYVSQFFAIRTDLDSLMSPDLPWRKGEAQVAREFPEQGDDIAVVIDGETSELADRAAGTLTDRLRARSDLYESVSRVNGGAFFDREGLLFLSAGEVRNTTARLISAQPLLTPLAADPSLRGLLTSLDTGLAAVANDATKLEAIDYPFREIGRVVSEVESGRTAFLSWRALFAGGQANPSEARQFIELIPKLDFSQVAPGSEAVAEVRQAVQALELTPERGVRVRVTGSVPILDDDFSTLAEASGPIALLMLSCMLAILYMALRSFELIFCVVLTLSIGAAVTSAAGLLMYGRFNLISVAFLPLFVGLAIDFAIQYCVRVRTEHLGELNLGPALAKAGGSVGRGLALAAAAIAAGFFAFLPTNYRGLSELGFIAGLGIVIAFLLTVTLLPALISLVGAPSPALERGVRPFFDAHKFVIRFRAVILWGGVLLAVASLFAIPFLKFDFDPMRLRSPKRESVATYLELSRTVETTPNTVNIESPTLETATVLAQRISALPEVARAVTVESFVPTDQGVKLALIDDARSLLDPSLNPFEIASPPTDAELVKKILDTEQRLLRTGRVIGASPESAILNLANALDRLGHGSSKLRSRAANALLAGFPTALHQVNTSLTAQPVTLNSLPPELRRQWVTPQGHALIQVFPNRQLSNPVVTAGFVREVQSVAPDVSGVAVDIVESGQTISQAFLDAGLLSAIAIVTLLFFTLRNPFWVAMAVTPVLLSGLLLFGTCVALGQDVNLENMIALPLLLGIGVAFNIYFIVAWRDGTIDLLNSSLTRAIVFSALTTGTAFASLSLSSHPGTASMGTLLLIALFWILTTTLIFLPALLSSSTTKMRRIAPNDD